MFLNSNIATYLITSATIDKFVVSKKQRLKNALSTKKAHSLTNHIIDGITVSFGIQNILPTTISSGGTIMARAKSAINELTGRTTGLNIFPDAPHFDRHFDIENAFTNPQTIAGVTALAYNELAKKFKVLPLKRESRLFAKKNIAVGIATGVFGEKSGLSTGAFDIITHSQTAGHGAIPVVGVSP